jgi:ankyrin repeat protein
MAMMRDDKGRNALAAALHAPSFMVSKETYQLLIMLNPCMLLERDDDGRIPFHIAIDSNEEWNFLRFILEHEPECIRFKDDFTGLYPFMLLATKDCVKLSELYEALSFCTDYFNVLTP